MVEIYTVTMAISSIKSHCFSKVSDWNPPYSMWIIFLSLFQCFKEVLEMCSIQAQIYTMYVHSHTDTHIIIHYHYYYDYSNHHDYKNVRPTCSFTYRAKFRRQAYAELQPNSCSSNWNHRSGGLKTNNKWFLNDNNK